MSKMTDDDTSLSLATHFQIKESLQAEPSEAKGYPWPVSLLFGKGLSCPPTNELLHCKNLRVAKAQRRNNDWKELSRDQVGSGRVSINFPDKAWAE